MPIEFVDEIELVALLGIALRRGASEVIDRGAIGIQRGALVDAGQEAAAPVGGMAFGQAAAEGVVHDDEAGEVFGFRFRGRR